MNGPGPKLEPKGAALEMLREGLPKEVQDVDRLDFFVAFGSCILDNFPDQFAQGAAESLAALRSQLTTLQAENEGLKADRAKLTDIIERNAVGNLRAIYGEKVQIRKLETGSQPESDNAPTA